MHKRLYFLVVTLLFPIIAIQSHAMDLAYVVTVDPLTLPGQARVTMHIANIPDGEFRLWEINTGSGYQLSMASISVTDANQNPLAATYTPGIPAGWNPDYWTVDLSGNTECHVDYVVTQVTVECSECANNEMLHYAYIGPELMTASAAHVFIAPGDAYYQRYVPDSMTIRFNTPAGWKIIVPWPETDGAYAPKKNPNVNFYENFEKQVFGLGKFDLFSSTIGLSRVTAAFYSDWPQNLKTFLLQKLWRISLFQITVWGISLKEPYFMIFPPHAVGTAVLSGGTGSMSQIIPLPVDMTADFSTVQCDDFTFLSSSQATHDGNFTPNWVDFSHEIAETRWIDYDWGYTGNSCYWLKYGSSQYYGMKTAERTRTCSTAYTLENFLGKYQQYMDDYVIPGTDFPISDPRADTDKALVVNKVPMVMLFLGKEIYTRTRGRRTLDDFQKFLFEKYSFGNTIVEEALLKTELEFYTGSDFTQFFNDFIYGTEPLPVEWISLDDDQDGLPNGMEVVWDTDPNRRDTDGDGLTDGYEVDHFGDPNGGPAGPMPAIMPLLLGFD